MPTKPFKANTYADSQMREAYLEDKCRRYAELQGCFLWKLTQPTGVPDRICVLPNGRQFFVEFKRPNGGKVSPIQAYIHAQLTKLGHEVFVVDNRAAFERLLDLRLALPNVTIDIQKIAKEP